MYNKMLELSKQPLLIVISGPSGSGKDSVIKRMKARGLPFHFVVTTTSRARRPDEVDGEDYYFVTRSEFEGMIERDELFEYALVYKDYKGIPKERIKQAMSCGQDVIMRLDVQGAETVHSKSPHAILIFLSTRNEAELRGRLERRSTETAESLKVRINKVRQEFEKLNLFDYYVVNADGKLDEAVDIILSIIKAEHQRVEEREVDL
jgi:guanylate kinase